MTTVRFKYDVIVVGGGHAGTEAALASARMGVSTLLISHNIETLGQMSCNPAIGGIGKGHLVKEIDALGGIMAKAADVAGIQFRTLNSSKGHAVRATRAQADRQLYRAYIRQTLENTENLIIFQEAVNDFIIKQGCIQGVVSQSGLQFHASAVVLTAGTFLAGKIHIGLKNYAGGRAGDPSATTLAQRLREIFPHTKRLKTGTPPRIDRRTVDFSQMQEQLGDNPTPIFSYLGTQQDHPVQISCYITHTNSKTHDIIRADMAQSPLYTGVIEGEGPRYCPSIEDKVVRFADKQQHQIFVEPEGLTSTELYPNGISTSLPFVTQYKIVRSIKGFEQAHIIRAGYAIEYDYFDPTQLHSTLETKSIAGLFFGGQINGTTGYEEAAAQGLLAGANAACTVLNKAPLALSRSQSYIGVMIDDLITQGTKEPYRMFTSRAEYRLSLREDNADLRLTPLGREIGLVDTKRWQFFETKQTAITKYLQHLKTTKVSQIKKVKTIFADKLQELSIEAQKQLSIADLFKRPDWHQQDLQAILNEYVNLPQDLPPQQQQIVQQIYIQLKYAGYLQRQQQEIQNLKQREEQRIPNNFDYASLASLSNEVKQKLTYHRPEFIGQASRIAGITPAAISVLLVALKQKKELKINKPKQAKNTTERKILTEG